MPYTITTRDGITINDIPDDMPADSPMLKERVAKIRGQGAPSAPPPGISAPSSGIAMGLRDSVDAGAQMLRRVVGDKIGGAVDDFGNKLADMGLPVARSNGVQGVDRIVQGVNQGYEASRKAAGVEGFDWARLSGNMLNPVNYVGGGAVGGANTIKNLAIAGGKAGAVSGALQPVTGDTSDFWTTKGGQAVGGAVAGAVATPIIASGAAGAAKGMKSLFENAGPPANPQTIRVQVNNVFQSQGMNPAQLPKEILDSVQRQVDEATRAGARLDPAAIVRKAQFEAVGLSGDAAPTLGQATRDPMQFANEKNLSGVRLKTPQGEGNPLADRFQLQNQRLGEVFDQVGARDATDRVTAGQSILESLRAADAPVKSGVDAAYEAARGMTGGRAAELDRAVFSEVANKGLNDGMWGRFVPEQINGLLNDITSGKTPFTVDAAEQIDGILSAAQRRAGKGSPEASAIGVIRQALHDAPFIAPEVPVNPAAAAAHAARDAARTVDDGIDDVVAREIHPTGLPGQRALPAPGSRALAPGMSVNMEPPAPGTALGPVIPPGAAPIDEGAAAREAFAQARAAARSRFATIENTPALKAALDNEAPDSFVRSYILGADVQDLKAMKDVLTNSPQAMAQARAQVAEHLKAAAFGMNPSGDKAFTAERYLQTLRAIGPKKLEVFFSPAELVRLNLAGKVASDINSIPVGAKYGTNTSGTGAALMNLLSKISESPMLRQLPGARAIANHVGEIKTEREINRALSAAPEAAKPQAQLSPEAMRALQLLFTPAGVASGVLGGAAVNP